MSVYPSIHHRTSPITTVSTTNIPIAIMLTSRIVDLASILEVQVFTCLPSRFYGYDLLSVIRSIIGTITSREDTIDHATELALAYLARIDWFWFVPGYEILKNVHLYKYK